MLKNMNTKFFKEYANLERIEASGKRRVTVQALEREWQIEELD